MKNQKLKYLIMGKIANVRFLKGLTEKTGNVGIYDPASQTIAIDKDISQKEELERTIYHELTHGMIFRAGLAQVLSDEVVEILCEQNATLIYENFVQKKR